MHTYTHTHTHTNTHTHTHTHTHAHTHTHTSEHTHTHTHTHTHQVGSKLNVKVPSGTKDFASGALCKAMFDIYLGDSPVSPHAKSAMAKGLISMSH